MAVRADRHGNRRGLRDRELVPAGLVRHGQARRPRVEGTPRPRGPAAAAEAAKSLGGAGNAGSVGGAEIATAAAKGGGSFASNFFTFGGTSGIPVLEVLVFNPVAQNLLIMGGTSLFSLDVIDDLVQWLREQDVKSPDIKGEF